ncbi:MAG: PorV/PorQ family protein [Elusimicrobiota bacterium]|nr:PorV/PorQ family protein [Elusimicrobiota bacterium]
MMNKFLKSAVTAAVLVSSYLTASYAASGSSGAAFLKIAPGAAPVGMGGAHTAIAGDINALYYNLAGISSIRETQIGASHTEWVSDIRYDYAAGAFKINKGVLGISATLLTMGQMEGRGEDSQETEDFEASDFAFQASYSRGMYGGSIKLIRQSIADETALGVAFDAGVNKSLPQISDNLNLGVAVRNIGPKVKFMSEGYSLPATITAGLGYGYGVMLFAVDTGYEPVEEKFTVSIGAQWRPVEFLSLRGGYFLDLLQSAAGSGSEELSRPGKGLGGGVGLNISNYSMNYAVVPYSDLGNTQRISIIGMF